MSVTVFAKRCSKRSGGGAEGNLKEVSHDKCEAQH